MSSPELDKKAPTFNLPSTGDKNVDSSYLIGQHLVIFFYPRDATPGCTTEAQDFRDALKKFSQLNTVIFGVSQDSITSHEKFRNKHDMGFDLLSDESGDLCEKYDVIKLKKMYGKEFMGIERSTFLIDAEGILRSEWRKVKVPGHVDEVLDAVKTIHSAVS